MDIALLWDGRNLRGDFGLRLSDLQVDPGGLTASVLVSLFTDRLAPPGYEPPAGSTPGRRGWWGDTYEDEPIGSLLWTLNRSKKVGDITLLVEAQDMCRTALQWMIDQDIASAVDVQTGWQQPDTLAILIRITKPDGTVDTFNADYAWAGTGT